MEEIDLERELRSVFGGDEGVTNADIESGRVVPEVIVAGPWEAYGHLPGAVKTNCVLCGEEMALHPRAQILLRDHPAVQVQCVGCAFIIRFLSEMPES